MLKKANVQNFSIYRYEHLLFAYMEYTGNDYEADMALIAADPETQRWWKITGPMQKPVPEVEDGQWWLTIPEKFHLDQSGEKMKFSILKTASNDFQFAVTTSTGHAVVPNIPTLTQAMHLTLAELKSATANN